MSKTITIAGQKGGTGKSVTSVNLAASLALFEKNTLLIDCDPQGCATRWCGAVDLEYKYDITSVLSGGSKIQDAIVRTQMGFLDMMPAGFNLFHAALKLSQNPGNEKILRLFLKDLEDKYEYIIIDSSSSYNFLSITAYTAADCLLVCMNVNCNSLHDFHCLLRMVKYIRTTYDVPLKIAGVLFNRSESDQEVFSFLEHQGLSDIKPMVYHTFIPEDDNIQKSIDLKIPAALHDIKSRAAQAYLEFAAQLHSSFK